MIPSSTDVNRAKIESILNNAGNELKCEMVIPYSVLKPKLVYCYR